MCNEVARRIALGELREDFSHLKIRLVFPEGAPNMAPLDSVRITDTTVIIRAADTQGDAASPGSPQSTTLRGDLPGSPQSTTLRGDLVSRRWSWPGAGGRPVYNYRSDGRDLGNHGVKGGRCLIPVDSFFEFTAPADGPKSKRKDKWRFRSASHDWLCIAGLWRADASVGEAFTLLTCPPGPDVVPYHARQVVAGAWGLGGVARWVGGVAGAVPARACGDVCGGESGAVPVTGVNPVTSDGLAAPPAGRPRPAHLRRPQICFPQIFRCAGLSYTPPSCI